MDEIAILFENSYGQPTLEINFHIYPEILIISLNILSPNKTVTEGDN